MEFDIMLWIVPLMQAGILVLAVAGLYCLFCCEGKDHRSLVWTAAVFLGTLAVWMGGGILLGWFGLAWRTAPSLVLCGAAMVSGWVGIVFTLACFLPAKGPGVSTALRRVLKGIVLFFAAVVLVITLWICPIMLIFGFGDTERVVDDQGRTLLEVNDGFLDSHYSYYAYCGPLVRGTERIYETYESHLGGDFG